MEQLTILVTACGSSNARSVCKILKERLPNCHIIGTDSNGLGEITPIDNVVKMHRVPLGKDVQYPLRLLDIAIEHQVDYIIPIHDAELYSLSTSRSRFKDQGITICVPDPNVVNICNDKFKFCQFCENHNLSVIPTSLKGNMDFPFFMKPRFGNGSENCFRIENDLEWTAFSKKVDNPIYQPFVEGSKMVVDFVADMNGDLVSSLPREELKSIDGNGTKVIIRKLPLLTEVTRNIVKLLNYHGIGNLEFFVNKQSSCIIELNPRPSSGIIFSYLAGLDILAQLLLTFGCLDFPPRNNPIAYNQRMHREWTEIKIF